MFSAFGAVAAFAHAPYIPTATFAVAGFPIVFSMLAALMMFHFPLDTRRMAIIGKRLRQLQERDARAWRGLCSRGKGALRRRY